MTDNSTRTALILGATGGIGGAIAAALLRHGWKIRALVRDPAKAASSGLTNCTLIGGDAMNEADVIDVARGASVIVHAVNPAGYQNWERLVLPMIDNTIAAAKASGARIMLPGTIYNFDPAETPVIGTDTPQRPKSRKGRIRVELEKRLEAASRKVPVLILRAGDFFGSEAGSSWFSQAMISPGKPIRRVVSPGKGVGHSWAYLPDLAETVARLLDREEKLGRFERLQFEGIWDETGGLMAETIRQVTGRPELPEKAFAWWLMRLLSPFGGFPREVMEIRDYWRHPVRLDNSRLVAILGEEPRTELSTAMRTTLAGLGCLPQQPQGRAIALA